MSLQTRKISLRYFFQTLALGLALALFFGILYSVVQQASESEVVFWGLGFACLLTMGMGLAFHAHYVLIRPLHQLRESLSKLQMGERASDEVSITPTHGLICEFAEIEGLFHELVHKLQFRQRELLLAQADLKLLNHNLALELDMRRIQLESRVAASFQQNKLHALGEMAAGIAHEINNPLAILVGRTEQLRDIMTREGGMESRRESILQSMEKTLFRIQEAVLDLELISSSPTEEELRPLPLSRLIRRLNKVVSNRYQTQLVSFEPEIETDLVIEGREVELSQALLYLLENASEAAQKSEAKWVKVELKRSGESFCSIVIIDSGSGIDVSLREKLFQPFFSTKDDGRGMGLSLAKAMIESHQGTLGFDFNHGNTTVHICLPMRQQRDPDIQNESVA